MRKFRRPFLFASISVCLVSTGLQAKSPAAPKAKASATPDQAKDPQVLKILSDLRPVYPHLTAAEIVRTSNQDLRKMYEHLFHTEGLSLHESKQKAAVIPLKGG